MPPRANVAYALAQLDEANFTVTESDRGPIEGRVAIERSKTDLLQSREHLARTQQRSGVHRGHVVRVGERFAQPDWPVVAPVVVLGVIVDTVVLEMQIDIGQDGRSRESELLERELVHEGLEGRSWLPLCQDTVVFAETFDIAKVWRADVGENIAGRIVEHEHRRCGDMPARQALHRALRENLRFSL